MNFIAVNNFGCFCYMPYESFRTELIKNKIKAKDILATSEFDHIIYGYVLYNDNYRIVMCRIDIIKLNDSDFYGSTNISNYLIYAVHKNN